MEKKFTKDKTIKLKNESISKMDTMLNNFIDADPKKAQLISYWLKDFVNYITYEDKFNPKKNVSYKRGDVINVNFGFNINSEFGGRHYAVVINNNSAHHSDSITVIPLSSSKPGKTVHPNDVFLGNDLYKQLSAKTERTIDSLNKELSSYQSMRIKLQKGIDNVIVSVASSGKMDSFYNLSNDFDKKLEQLGRDIDNLTLLQSELNHLKEGSIAKTEQITTISKMRIYNPKSSKDTLYRVCLSAASMDKINDMLKKLYIFNE